MTTSPPVEEPEASAPEITYSATLQPLENTRRPTAVQRFSVYEYRAGGWVAEATVNPAPGPSNRNIVFEAFRDALGDGMAPGEAVTLRLITRQDQQAESTQAMLARAWPSVVRQLIVEPTADAVGNSIYKVEICDPVTYLSGRPIWGAYHEVPLGPMIGGVLSLAVGGDGEPTLTPTLPGLPRLQIETHLRPPSGGGAASATTAQTPADYNLRYAIAVGEPLGLWLSKTLSRLGVRMETEVQQDGGLCLHLLDDVPVGDPLVMTFEASGEASETNATLFDLNAFPTYPSRAALQDNPTSDIRRVGDPGAIGQVITAAGLGTDEAAERASFAAETHRLAQRTFRVVTKQSLVRPGWRMEFANINVDGTNAWQMANVSHYFGSGGYHNLTYLQKDGEAWRPLIPADNGPVVVSATVDDGESDPGEPVDRDRLGRIPMRFGFLPRVDEQGAAATPSPTVTPPVATPGAANAQADLTTTPPATTSPTPPATTSSATTPPVVTPGAAAAWNALAAAPPVPPASEHTIPRVPLPIIELMGGSQHGFVPAHRQGDLCRVLVHHPFFAEIYGFVYRDDRRVGANLADVSTGLVVRHDADSFSGLLFRPDEDLEDLRPSTDE